MKSSFNPTAIKSKQTMMRLLLLTFLLVFSAAKSQNWNIATGGNVLHNGLCPTIGPNTPNLLWSGGLPSQIAFAPVTDSIYLATVRIDNISDPLNGNKIVMMDIRTGDTIWTRKLPVDFPATDWSNRVSAIRNGVLYASRSGNSNEAYLYALDASNGSILWKSDSLIGESINEGACFLPGGDLLVGNLFSIARISSANGSTVWQTSRLGYQNGAELAVYGSKVYGLMNIANAVRVAAYDTTSGQMLYTSPPLSGGLVQQLGLFMSDNGTIYVPRSQNNPTTDFLFSLTDNGSAIVLNWSFPIDYVPFSSSGIGPDGSVYCYNPSGRVVRLNPQNGSVVDSSLVVLYGDAFQPRMSIDSTGKVFLTNGGFNDGNLYSFNADLTLRWQSAVPNVNVGGPVLGWEGTLVICGIGTDFRAYKNETTTGIENSYIEASFELYPNPASDFIFIKDLDQDTELSIVDLNGKEVDRTRVLTNPHRVDVSGLARGVYLIRALSGNTSVARRLVKY
jgi:outer membrane protein assembly factor BamB